MADEHSAIWDSAPYGPTAERLGPVAQVVAARLHGLVPSGAALVDIGAGHGAVAELLAERGHQVVALEPASGLRTQGQICTRRHGQAIQWRDATGEQTGLEDASCDGIASSFATMFCTADAGPQEWRRILRPGGALVMTAWDQRGFLASMTRQMFAVLHQGAPPSGHMDWGDDDFARAALEPHFRQVDIEHHNLLWGFDSVADGMHLYREGSPSHRFSLTMAGDRAADLEQALEDHLRQHETHPGGPIRSYAGYALVTAIA